MRPLDRQVGSVVSLRYKKPPPLGIDVSSNKIAVDAERGGEALSKCWAVVTSSFWVASHINY